MTVLAGASVKIDAVPGLTVTEVSTSAGGASTVTVALPCFVTPPTVAEARICVVPAPAAVTRPPPETVATAGSWLV